MSEKPPKWSIFNWWYDLKYLFAEWCFNYCARQWYGIDPIDVYFLSRFENVCIDAEQHAAIKEALGDKAYLLPDFDTEERPDDD